MTNLAGNPVLFVRTGPTCIKEITGLQLSNCMNAGHESFQNLITTITKHFDCKSLAYDNFYIFGSQFKTMCDGSFSTLQKYYAKILNIFSLGNIFEKF